MSVMGAMHENIEIHQVHIRVNQLSATRVRVPLNGQPFEGVKMLFRNWCMSIGGGERR